ncbi:MAG: hypothetical protein A2Y25_09160 [Candidatus Melainabacteria bacterium GWF2_37_15]|nr:MAG: hypothetical protein A2Y25_09160 [Candidatus Melainabacteria bacterium GWF2_37_15]
MNTQRKTKKTKILIVDDDFDYLLQQKLILEAEGHEVITAENESQAKEIINTQDFDLAIVDLMMEDMDSGFILSYEIKKKHPLTPVIIVTAVKSQTGFSFESITQEEKKWIKADLILAKPVRAEQILKEIQKLQAA